MSGRLVSTPLRLGALLAERLHANAHQTALRFSDADHSYATLIDRAIDYQLLARSKGVTSTDVVVCVLDASLDFYAALLAGVFGSYTVAFLSPASDELALRESLVALNPRIAIGEPD